MAPIAKPLAIDLPPKNRTRFGDRICHIFGRKRHTPEQIINKLREAEVLLSKGMGMPKIFRKLAVSEQTYYRWRKEYGGVRSDQAKRLKELEKENVRLKKLVAELSLDKQMLEEIAQGKF